MQSILVVSHSYPLQQAPFKAKFIQDQVLLFNDSTLFNVEVLNLTPKTIPFSARRKIENSGFKLYGESVFKSTYFSFPRKKFPNLIQMNISKAMNSFLRTKTYDLIHIHWLYPCGLAIRELKAMGRKTILTIHGSDWYQSIEKQDVKQLVFNALDEVDEILFSGPQLQNDVLKVLPHLKPKTRLIYNFIDSQLYQWAPPELKTQKKESLGFKREYVHALTIASLREEKGIDLLIDAIKENEFENTHFHIVGLIEETEYARSILKSVKQNTLGTKVTFHGLKSPRELLNYYQAADFYLLPSRREGFNLSVLEASATGLPVLCTNVGGNSEVIDANMGVLVTPNNKEELGEGIKKILSTLSTYDSKYISEKTTSKFSEKMMKKRLSDIYSEVID